MRHALGLEYDGRAFCGFQAQPDGCSVQDALERALAAIADAPVRVIGAGRTDAGVHAGYRTALYTSPHLLRFNERVRIGGVEATDEALVTAFDAVESARTSREAVPLTYFEFSTLAALHVFAAARIDAIVLEVGLGGRLDAVNIVDADVAVVTSIGIDHVDYLGSTREAIGREKAGIFRAGRPAICGDADPPASLVAHADAIGAPLWRIGRDYTFMPNQQELVATGRTEAEIAVEIGADLLVYQELDALKEAVRDGNPALRDFEASCFDGRYITGDITIDYLSHLASERDQARGEAESDLVEDARATAD